MTELVVLLDGEGAAIGTAPKATVHHRSTPLHLAFSAYLVTSAGDLLVTRRADTKPTFPGVWTNSVCGHPGPGEPLETAVRRRAQAELGTELAEVRLVLPSFAYTAEQDGVVENELCPVYLAVVETRPPLGPDPAEVMCHEWVPWADFASAVLDGRRRVAPWCAQQIRALTALGPDPHAWARAEHRLLPRAAREPVPDEWPDP